MYQPVPLRVRMPEVAKASGGVDLWSLYLSGADLQRAVRGWPVSRYLQLACSPGTRAFLVTGWDVQDGRVDLSAEGVCHDVPPGGEISVISYTVRADELSHAEKVQLMETVRATYSSPRASMTKIKQMSAKALGVALLGR